MQNDSSDNEVKDKGKSEVKVILRAMDLCELYGEMRISNITMTEYEYLMYEQLSMTIQAYIKSIRRNKNRSKGDDNE